MTIETDLKSLVETYADFNAGSGCYLTNTNKEKPVKLELLLNQLLIKWLVHDGPEKAHIEKNYAILEEYFNTKKAKSVTPELIWVECQLLASSVKTTCSDILFSCYNHLMVPADSRVIIASEVSTKSDLERWLNNLKTNSRTNSERRLYESLLGLLDESTGYFDEVGVIRPKGVKALVSFLPVALVSLGTIVFIEELLAVYALYFVLLKSGQFIGKANSTDIKIIGDALQKAGTLSATVTSTVLVQMVHMVFWSSNQCCAASQFVGSSLFAPLLPSPVAQRNHLEQDLAEAVKNKQPGMEFKNPEFKIIAAPLEAHLGILTDQLFLNFRAGRFKRPVIKALLFNISLADKDPGPREKKFNTLQELFNNVKKNNEIYLQGERTALAIDDAVSFLNYLKDRPLLLPETPCDSAENTGIVASQLA